MRWPGSKKQLRTVLLIFLVSIIVIAFAFFIFFPKDYSYELRTYTSHKVQKNTIQDTLEIPGTVGVRYQTTILATESGILESVSVSEGDWVQANQAVAVIYAEPLENNLKSMKRQLKTQTRDYEKFLLQQEQNLLAAARQRTTLKTAITEAEENFADTEQNNSLGFASQDELEDARDQLAEARAALENFEAEQEISLKLFKLNELDYKDALQVIQDDIKSLEEQLTNTIVYSPIKGRVVTLIDNLAIGGPIQENTFIMEIADTEQLLILSAIEEQYVSFISAGYPVMVSLSGQKTTGSIEKIGLSAQLSTEGGTPTVSLEIAIRPAEYLIIPGSSAVIELVLEEIEGALILPRGPYLTSGNRRYLYRIKDNKAERVDITVGAVTESLVQILSGISEGDEIITSSYQNFIDYEIITLGGNK